MKRFFSAGLAAGFFALLISGNTTAVMATGTDGAAAGETQEPLRWASSFQTAMEQAQVEQKYVMVDFYTGWCHWCKVLDQVTYKDPRVAGMAEKMVSVKVNAEAETRLRDKYGVRGYPTIVFLNPDGTLRQRVVGYKPPEAFLPVLQQVLSQESEIYALGQQVENSPEDVELRQNYARMLARSGDFHGAAAQMDSLLARLGDSNEISKENRSSLELDRWIYLHRAGNMESVRKGLEQWIKKGKGHPRSMECRFFLAQAEERDGRAKQSRKLYQEIAKKQPGSWLAEVARAKLGS